MDYRIQNLSGRALRNVYVAIFADPDIGNRAVDGYFQDDEAALFDSTVTYIGSTGEPVKRRIQMAYAWDNPDNPNRPQDNKGGDVPGDGYFGCMFLNHTVDPAGCQRAAAGRDHVLQVLLGLRLVRLGRRPGERRPALSAHVGPEAQSEQQLQSELRGHAVVAAASRLSVSSVRPDPSRQIPSGLDLLTDLGRLGGGPGAGARHPAGGSSTPSSLVGQRRFGAKSLRRPLRGPRQQI
jgi:hypothetical protein